jgi:hypothetical protein
LPFPLKPHSPQTQLYAPAASELAFSMAFVSDLWESFVLCGNYSLIFVLVYLFCFCLLFGAFFMHIHEIWINRWLAIVCVGCKA